MGNTIRNARSVESNNALVAAMNQDLAEIDRMLLGSPKQSSLVPNIISSNILARTGLTLYDKLVTGISENDKLVLESTVGRASGDEVEIECYDQGKNNCVFSKNALSALWRGLDTVTPATFHFVADPQIPVSLWGAQERGVVALSPKPDLKNNETMKKELEEKCVKILYSENEEFVRDKCNALVQTLEEKIDIQEMIQEKIEGESWWAYILLSVVGVGIVTFGVATGIGHDLYQRYIRRFLFRKGPFDDGPRSPKIPGGRGRAGGRRPPRRASRGHRTNNNRTSDNRRIEFSAETALAAAALTTLAFVAAKTWGGRILSGARWLLTREAALGTAGAAGVAAVMATTSAYADELAEEVNTGRVSPVNAFVDYGEEFNKEFENAFVEGFEYWLK